MMKIEEQNVRTPLETVVPLDTPYVIYIDPCGECNFECYFCPCRKSSFRNEERYQTMSFELFKKIVDDMKGFKNQVKVVDLWAWGEPFLNKDLIKMIRYLKESKVCRDIRTCTNGSLLNPKMNQELVDSGLDLIRISVEGLNAGHYKEICNVDFDFDELIYNVKDLYKRSRGKLKVSIKIVEVMLKTQEDIDNFYKLFDSISDYTFIEDVVDAFPGFDGFQKPDNTKVNFRKWNSYKDRGNYVCTKPLVQMAIHSNGIVSACCNDWKFATQYGDLNHNNLVELWHSDRLKNFRLQHLEMDRSKIPYCNICACESEDDIDDVRHIIAERVRSVKGWNY
ncbi:radical SAM/SPASM domain-containing protein [Aminipila sp.]|uniref:radical SAM/SPASM domain-containing protein n=1 Tax=Aminipila sp. TaxID=2060095 RepID=UPI0028974A02|nr:radical SAM protein [Aminipila sp.]